MNKPTSKERIKHIGNAIALVKSFVENQTEDEFSIDVKCQNAVLYQFLIIGEALRHVDSGILEKYPYPWHIPKSFRNFIAHEYHKIRLTAIYRAAKDLDFLQEQITLILENEF